MNYYFYAFNYSYENTLIYYVDMLYTRATWVTTEC